jgi:hypothetical protein
MMGTAVAASITHADFDVVVSPGAKTCLPHARGEVHITSIGPVEIMNVDVSGLPPKTDFDFFVIQTPNASFGVSWYQGDIETNKKGEGSQKFIARFSIETFAVSPGAVTPPQVHTDGMFPDATTGVTFRPIHTYHLGLWFNSPADAAKAGCPNTRPRLTVSTRRASRCSIPRTSRPTTARCARSIPEPPRLASPGVSR